MKGTAIVGSGIFPGLSGWMLSSVLKEAFNDDLIEMIIGGVYNFSKAAAIDYVEEIKSYKAGIPMACVRNGKILPAQKRSPLNLPTRISKLSILPYVTEEIQEIIQGKYMLNIDSYTAAPVSLFSIVNKAHCQKKDLVNALMGQKNSNQKAFIWVRQNKGNDSRCIYFEGKNPSVLTGEILAITANAIFEMPRKEETFEQIWPDAVKKALEILFKQNRTEKMSMAQYQIYVSKLWSEICQKVGYMNIVDYDNFGDIKSIFYDLEKRHLIKKENDGIE